MHNNKKVCYFGSQGGYSFKGNHFKYKFESGKMNITIITNRFDAYEFFSLTI